MSGDGIQPLDPAQAALQEREAAAEGYLKRCLVGLDQFVNVITDGDADETISSRAARAAEKGKRWGVDLSKVLDLFQRDHGAKAQAGDLERALRVARLERLSGAFTERILPGRRLGLRAVKTDTRTLQLKRYMSPELPKAPAAADWSRGITSWGMLLNDTLGDCTIAGVGHAIQVWTANLGVEAAIDDREALQYYESWDGYNPSNPATDLGGVELNVLNDWRRQGFAGHKLLAYADLAATDVEGVKQAIALFGGIYIGLTLPLSAQQQDVWDVVQDDGGVWGGHCVFVLGYDSEGLTCVTWGSLKRMTWAFWGLYTVETHALLSPDWIGAKGSPGGFDLKQLQADLEALG